MKKYLAIIMVVAFLVSGCALFKSPCTTLTPQKMTDAEIILKGIQAYYAPLQALVAMIPTVGGILAVAIPAALSAADIALNDLGTVLATNCANDQAVTLAQIALNTIEALFKTPEVQTLTKTAQYKAMVKLYSPPTR